MSTPHPWVGLAARVAALGYPDQLVEVEAVAALARLVEHAVLRRDERRFLGLFERTAYPTVNPQLEFDLRRRLADVVDRRQPAPSRTVALLSLALACDMEARLSSRADRDRVRTRMEELAGDEPVGSVVRAAIDAVDDALMAAAGVTHAASDRSGIPSLRL